MESYISTVLGTSVESLYKIPHVYRTPYPTGFIVRSATPIEPFPFTICPLTMLSSEDPLPISNPQDVVVEYEASMGSLETVLYTLYQRYKDTQCTSTDISKKYYLCNNVLSPRKIIIPCFKRQENLRAVLQRFQTIDLPLEGYRPPILLVEHSPYPEIEKIAEEFNCEYLWIFMDYTHPELPLGQFNKALCYDKAFLFGTPASWYLFHDNDVLVPKDFWNKLDQNVERAKTQFIQPYTNRCLINLKPPVAEMLRENLSLADEAITEDMYFERHPGAPGGSLYLTRNRYLEAGGHDPNICWGYGPEDAMFYEKLSILEDIAFADNPAIEMIHLWHPSAAPHSVYRTEMDIFVKQFFKQMPREQKIITMQQKRQILESILATRV